MEQQAKNNIMKKLINFIEKYSDKYWDWGALSFDESLTIDFIDNNHNKDWDWEAISLHSFKTDYQNILKKLRFDHYHEELIQKTWHPSRFMDWCVDEEDKSMY